MMKIGYRKTAVMLALALVVSLVGVVATPDAALASPKSMYVIAYHHAGFFDAWNINPGGTVTYQATHGLLHAMNPADVAMDEDSATLFITAEGWGAVELVDAVTMTSLGFTPAPGAWDLSGIEVDDANNIVYTVDRGTNTLYAYDWDDSTNTLTARPGYPIALPGTVGAWGLALDETSGILYVADSAASTVRGYDVNTWAEVFTVPTPVQAPCDIAVDRLRGFLITTAPDGYCAYAYSGVNLLVKIDIATQAVTTHPIGHGTMGVAVDEVSGYAYVTGGCNTDTLEVWDPSTNPWTLIQNAGVIGTAPAGICIPQTEVVFNPLNLSKDDGLGGQCVNPGQNINYQICYDNAANNFPVNNVTIVDDLPPEVSYVSDNAGGTYDSVNHRVTWSVGDLPAGDPGSCIELVVNVPGGTAGGTVLTNFCTIDSDNTPPATVTMQTTVCSDGGPPPKVPGMTGWGITAVAMILAALIPLAIRRRVSASSSR
jgi:uncharacterized repeat protein (TIGR01451 family)